MGGKRRRSKGKGKREGKELERPEIWRQKQGSERGKKGHRWGEKVTE